MNKTWTFIFLFSYLMLMSIVAQSIGYTVSNDITVVNQGFDISISGTLKVLGTFMNLLVFRVEGVPPLFTVFGIYPATGGILYILISLIRGTE